MQKCKQKINLREKKIIYNQNNNLIYIVRFNGFSKYHI